MNNDDLEGLFEHIEHLGLAGATDLQLAALFPLSVSGMRQFRAFIDYKNKALSNLLSEADTRRNAARVAREAGA